MKKLFSKKFLAIVTAVSLVTSISSITYAASTLTKITAYQNSAITVEVGGSEIDLTVNDIKLYPIIYEGRTYVPAKPLAEALGGTVQWDGPRQAVVITPEGNTPPKVTTPPKATTPPSTGGNTSTSESTSSSNKGTLTDPVKLGTSFTYTDITNYNTDVYGTWSAQYTVTVKKATSITKDDIEALGFERPKDDYNYLLVDLHIKTDKTTFKAGSDSYSDYRFLSSYKPSFWGSRTADGSGVIGVTHYGFEGSLSSNTDKVLSDFPTVKAGESKSYEVTGKVIVPTLKSGESYLVLSRQDSTLNYNDTHIYFKLK